METYTLDELIARAESDVAELRAARDAAFDTYGTTAPTIVASGRANEATNALAWLRALAAREGGA